MIQFKCTTEMSFNMIESTFSVIHKKMIQEPSTEDELAGIATHIFTVWSEKIYMEIAHSVSQEMFAVMMETSMKIHVAWIRKQNDGRPEVIDMPMVRAIFKQLSDELSKSLH